VFSGESNDAAIPVLFKTLDIEITAEPFVSEDDVLSFKRIPLVPEQQEFVILLVTKA